MQLEKEAKAFMDRKSRGPRTLFEVLKEINIKLEKLDEDLKEVKEIMKKVKLGKVTFADPVWAQVSD